MSHPVKISDELILDARLTAQIAERSIAGQIEFWAQLGRAIEPLLEGSRALALRQPGAAIPRSEQLASVDSAAGRQRVTCSSGFGRRVGTDSADELVHQVRSGRKGDVNALR
jgi:ParD-like antitoxin of type II bacterial toxin-antitoxin system